MGDGGPTASGPIHLIYRSEDSSRMSELKHKRILAIHDISCVGRCSLTVALPIISAAGVECSVLPTAVLSTHTGGFQGFTYRDLTCDMRPIMDHWKSLDIRFDAFYTGFLGSFEQIDIVSEIFDELSHQGTTVYVDPVMADAGKLYSVFGPEFPAGMKKLCEKADVIMPNLTELCLMLGLEWKPGPYSREYIDAMLEHGREFGVKRIVITGVSFEEGRIGAVFRDFETGESGEVMRDEIPGYYHGTGDVFGSALVGSCERGASLKDSVEAAVELTVGSIKNTRSLSEDIRYGVNFEPGLKNYAESLDRGIRGFAIVPATNDQDIRTVSSLAMTIWGEAFKGIISDSQILYMLERFQSFDALKTQIEKEGYSYLVASVDGEPVGYCGYRADGDSMFLSKIYLLDRVRGKGYSSIMVDELKRIAKDSEASAIRLTVNRKNIRAIEIYKHMGFVQYGTADTDIGHGFEMNDFLMELKVQ